MDEIKGCPFCGADAEISYSEWTDSAEPPERHHVWSVGCSVKATREYCCPGRLAMNRGWKDRDEAIAAWNRRAAMTKTDSPINVEAIQDPVHGDWDVSMCMCHTPRRIYVDNLTELGTNKSVHIYVERRTCKNVSDVSNDFKCSECGARSFVETDETYTTILSDERTVLTMFNFCPNCGAVVIS